jgi:hypothetical protein
VNKHIYAKSLKDKQKSGGFGEENTLKAPEKSTIEQITTE